MIILLLVFIVCIFSWFSNSFFEFLSNIFKVNVGSLCIMFITAFSLYFYDKKTGSFIFFNKFQMSRAVFNIIDYHNVIRPQYIKHQMLL